jgi:hypothetical protein
VEIHSLAWDTCAGDGVVTTMARSVGDTAESTVTAVIFGRLHAVGGPAPRAPRPLTGRHAHGPAGTFTTATGAEGPHRLRVPAGEYEVTGRSPRYVGECRARRVTNAEDERTHTVDVVCRRDLVTA